MSGTELNSRESGLNLSGTEIAESNRMDLTKPTEREEGNGIEFSLTAWNSN